jgi:hypothetical protein
MSAYKLENCQVRSWASCASAKTARNCDAADCSSPLPKNADQASSIPTPSKVLYVVYRSIAVATLIATWSPEASKPRRLEGPLTRRSDLRRRSLLKVK